MATACSLRIDSSLIAVVQQTAPPHPCIHFEILATQTALDGDFPKAGDAEKQLIVRCAHQSLGSEGQAVKALRCPQQKMGIQQQLRASDSNMARILSAAIVSKSSGTVI